VTDGKPPGGGAGSGSSEEDWFEQLEEGVVQVSGGVVVRLNAAAAKLLDVDPDLARGSRLISVVRDHRLEAVVTAAGLAASASGSGSIANVNAIEIDLNGRTVQAVPFGGGLLLRDRSVARQSERDARELLAVLSHELRTPVAAIVAVLDALALDLPKEQRDDFLARASEEAARLGRLISDLTVEVRPPRQRSVALDDTVARAVVVTETIRHHHGVGVSSRVPPIGVWVDPDKLLQALVNLIENAAVHGPDHELVEVVAEPSGAFVRVEVRDRGVPLDPTVALSLFETSSQVSVKARGTGLGLRIVRSMARAWGGDVWAGPRGDGVGGNAFGFSVRQAPQR
jgi:signal transduction histidine kinase